MDHKALKKLADACRKAGIKHFKNSEFEFTLSEEGPISNYKQRSIKRALSAPIDQSNDQSIATGDTLTEDQLLFFSVMEPEGEESTQ